MRQNSHCATYIYTYRVMPCTCLIGQLVLLHPKALPLWAMWAPLKNGKALDIRLSMSRRDRNFNSSILNFEVHHFCVSERIIKSKSCTLSKMRCPGSLGERIQNFTVASLTQPSKSRRPGLTLQQPLRPWFMNVRVDWESTITWTCSATTLDALHLT
jgi:hypothetical protein